ncbi:unnamed protein product [Rotaria sp. Silwood2]|nr:unnamed protein product [Rotaria sp. Silwood2]
MKYSTGTGSIPQSVAACDFNSDLRQDLAAANFGTNNIVIFFGTGTGTFIFQTIISTESSRPLNIIADDFNNDGQCDIATVNYGTNSIGIFLGYRNGNFSSQVTFSTGYDSFPISLAKGHFNHDNAVDIVVANYATNNIGLFLGYGNGSFRIQIILTTNANSHPYFIAVADFNNDSRLDIIVANKGSDSVSILSGHGNGSFSVPTSYYIGNNASPQSVAIGDYNKDNQLDVIVANYGTSELVLLLANGDGTFRNPTIFFTQYAFYPYSVAGADFNKDSRTDIAVVNHETSMLFTILSSDYHSLSNATKYSIENGSQPMSIVIADFNNDKTLDIAVANQGDSTVNILLGYSDGTFSSKTAYSTGVGSQPSSITVGDINNDKLMDIIVTNYLDDNVGVFLGYGNGTFSNQTIYSTGSFSRPMSIATGDFNGDNRLDLSVANSKTNNIIVLLGCGNGTFSNQMFYSTGDNSKPLSIASGDFNGDNLLDLTVANSRAGNIGVLFGYSNGTFSKQIIYAVGSGAGPTCVAVYDFNNDSYLDIIVALCFTDSVGIFLGYGDGSFLNLKIISSGSSSRPAFVTAGDFNNDNRLDIVVASNGTYVIGVLLGYGDGTFANIITYSVGNSPNLQSIAVGDFNSDHLLDMAVANWKKGNVGILLGTVTIIGVEDTTWFTGSAAHSQGIDIDDLNNDNRSDVVVANYGMHNIAIMFGYSNGTFPMQATFSTGSLSFPTSVVVGDLNSDKQPDIVVANSGNDNVGILFGQGNGSFDAIDVYSTDIGSKPQSIAIGDLNGDGRLDIVVASYGTRSVDVLLRYDAGTFGSMVPYSTGENSNTDAITVADLNNDGILDIVAANKGTGNIGIFLGKGNATFSNQTTFSTGTDSRPFSVATGDFNNDNRLDIAVANYWNSNVGILLGHGNGSFSRQMTYSTGTDSNPSSIAIGDLNNDHQLDIVTVSFTTNNIIILLGRGNGTFANPEMLSNDSYSQPWSVTVGDFNNDSRLDIAVAYYATGNILILIGHGDGTFLQSSSYSTGYHSQPYCIITNDFNNDNHLDLAVANFETNNIGILLGYGNGSFIPQKTYATGTGSEPRSLTSGDFNNDGLLDIVVGNFLSNNIGIFIGFHDGTFFSQITYSTGNYSSPRSVVTGDFNNDGRLDIAVANYNGNNLGVFLGYNDTNLLRVPAYSTGNLSRPKSIAVGDFDNDNRLDVVIANNDTDSIMILFGTGYGSFSSQIMHSTDHGSHPCGVTVGDLNKDAHLDIVVANSGNDNVGIFLGQGNRSFSSQATFFMGLSSNPYSVAVLDMDNDTLWDVAVTNFGTNSVTVLFGYSNGSFASRKLFQSGFGSSPYAITVGDVNQDNLPDIVTSNNGDGTISFISKTC